MTEKISEDQVKHVAELAKLKINDDQLPYFTTQLDKIIGLFETLSEVDTEGVEPTSSVTDQVNVMRDDVAENWHQQQALLDNALILRTVTSAFRRLLMKAGITTNELFQRIINKCS